jgi:hypothetical protein
VELLGLYSEALATGGWTSWVRIFTQCQLYGFSGSSCSKEIIVLVGSSGELGETEMVEELSELSALSNDILSLISSLFILSRRERVRALSKRLVNKEIL